jgi:hypothetical protein
MGMHEPEQRKAMIGLTVDNKWKLIYQHESQEQTKVWVFICFELGLSQSHTILSSGVLGSLATFIEIDKWLGFVKTGYYEVLLLH